MFSNLLSTFKIMFSNLLSTFKIMFSNGSETFQVHNGAVFSATKEYWL
uniref:Uncharacterized protein n=1 Tax=Setaria italica TaxID=4555 RepID=K4A3I2_SETIT